MSLEDEISAPSAERKFTFSSLCIGSDQPVVVWCRHAGYSNPNLTSAQIASFNERRSTRGAGGGAVTLTTAAVEADRVTDCKLFGSHVITKVENVFENGKPLEQTKGKFIELLLAISKKRYEHFRQFTAWATDLDNFVDAPLGSPDELGK